MNGDFVPILILVCFAAFLCAAMVTLSWVLGPKKVTPYKSSPYECGVEPVGSARERFPIKFYLVAMLFILFDIEIVFLWSWLTVYKDATTEFQIFSFIEVMSYMATWVLGYAYAVRVKAFDWDESTTLEEAKLREALEGDRMTTATPSVRTGALKPVGGGE